MAVSTSALLSLRVGCCRLVTGSSPPGGFPALVYDDRVTLVAPGSLPAGSVALELGGFLWPVNYLLLGLIVWCLSIILSALAPSHDNPLGLEVLQQPALNLLTNVVAAAAAVGLVVLAAAPFVRFRRAGYQQRQQLKSTGPQVHEAQEGGDARTPSSVACRRGDLNPHVSDQVLDQGISPATRNCFEVLTHWLRVVLKPYQYVRQVLAALHGVGVVGAQAARDCQGALV
jgi:hypothetical protein